MADSTRLPNVTDPTGPLRALAPQATGADPVHDLLVRCANRSSAQVADSITSVPLIASSVYRRRLTIWNNSTATLYLAFGVTAVIATADDYVEPGAKWQMPTDCVYTGAVNGIWDSATGGTANVNQWTA